VARSGVVKTVQSGMRSATTRRKSASTAAHQEIQNPLYLAPWGLFILAGFLGQLLFILWGERPWTWMPLTGMVLATGSLAYVGWLNTRARTSLALGHTLVTILVSGFWLTLCSATGLIRLEQVSWAIWRMPTLAHPTFDLFIILGCSLAFAWNMRQGVHAKEARDAALQGETMDEWGEAGVPGVRGTLKKKNEFFLTGTLTIPRGMSLTEFQHRRGAIESAWDWPLNSLTILPGPRGLTSRKVHARVMIKDPLAKGAPWPGIDRNPKLTLLDPIKEGIRADGETSIVYVATDSGAKHFLVQGMTGSGKTEGQKSIILECAYRGAVQIIIDIVSGVQMFGSMAPALQWLITDEGAAKAVLKRLAEEVIPARMEQLAREKKKNWDPSSSLKLLRVHVEEAWSLLDADELMDISVTARKAGVQLVISLQRASHDQLNTTVREQLGTRMCYGLGGSFGTMVLDDEVLDAGADPTKWKDEQPGMHYLTRGGLSVSEKATATRSYWDENGSAKVTFEREAVAISNKISEMDEVSAEAFGPLWDQHLSPLEVVRLAEEPTPRRRASAQPVAPVREPVAVGVGDSNGYHPAFAAAAAAAGIPMDFGPSDPEPVPVEILAPRADEIETGEEDDVLMVMGEDGNVISFVGPDGTESIDFGPDLEDLAPELDIVGDPFSYVIHDRPGGRPPLRLGKERVKVDREKLESLMSSRLGELKDGGRSVISAVDFTDQVIESGWGRTIVYKFLDAWTAAGLLVKTSEGYLFVRTTS
jgi:hypothetical protein